MDTAIKWIMHEAETAFRLGNYQAAVSGIKTAFDKDPTFLKAEASQFVASFPFSNRNLYWKAPPTLFSDRNNVAATFTTIYDKAMWGGGSGAGSDLRNTVLYIAYLQHFIERYNIGSIVDLGCGDWRFSKYLRLGTCSYLGLDVVPSVIETNQRTYGTGAVRFEVGDATRFDIPPCDLLLSKDVMQHLSSANVSAILSRLPAAKHALITNDYHPANDDCSNGDTRPLDISGPPFNVAATPRLAFHGKVTFLAGAASGGAI